jgi:hypothetical protein
MQAAYSQKTEEKQMGQLADSVKAKLLSGMPKDSTKHSSTRNRYQYVEEHTCTLYSLGDKPIKISINYNHASDKLAIRSGPSDALCLHGCRGFIDSIRIINSHFLELHFQITGGTGVRLERYVLVCVSKGRLHRAIDVLSVIESRFKETFVKEVDSLHLYDEHSVQKFNVLGLKNRESSFELTAEEYHYEKSKFRPEKNYVLQDTVNLEFDLQSDIFYAKSEKIYGDYTIDSDDNLQHEKRSFSGEEYPMIKINDNRYFFINGEWYMNDQENHLTLFPSKCD